MNFLDIIIVLVALVGFVFGYKDGFVRKLVGLFGLALAVFLALTFAFSFGKVIESFTGIEIYLAEIIAGIVIFLVVILIFTILKRFIHPFDKVNNLINQLTGGIVGIVQILFFMSALLIILNVFQSPAQNVKDSSYFYGKIYNIIPVTIDYLSQYTPEPKEIIKDYIRDKDTLQ